MLQNDGGGSFHVVSTVTLGQAPYALVVGDFNGDGHTDLIVADENDRDVEFLPGNGDGTFRDANPNLAGLQPNQITPGDFNGDGYTDLAVVNAYTQDLTILLGNGDGTFRRGEVIPIGFEPVAIVSGDFNGDGRADLAVAATPSGREFRRRSQILLGNGDGTFRTGRQSYLPWASIPIRS